MNHIKVYITIFAAMTICCSSCNDDFMNQSPQTDITVAGFFKTPEDLALYINGLYDDGNLISAGMGWDDNSDNTAFCLTRSDTWNAIYSTLYPDNVVGGWDNWGSLRKVNLMLNNLQRVTGDEAKINNYIGIARYCRAWFYFNKIKNYSDVPWSDDVLEANDPKLYAPADPRTLVADKIVEDLEFAIANISAETGNKTRVHKYCAMALLSRFCLYEGTYRKYHPELNLQSTANRFLERAVSISEELMNSGKFELTGSGTPLDLGNGVTGSQGFRDLFCSNDMSGNREIIQWVHYRYPHRSFSATQLIRGVYFGLSRSLQECFLTKDGRPFSTVVGYDRKTFMEVFTNRDPRLAETLAYPGCKGHDDVTHNPSPNTGGYNQSKGAARLPMLVGGGAEAYGASVTYRYAEVLLNYAEAKAELGQFGAAEAAKSINLLRSRVNMPSFDAAREVDETLRGQYPNITDNTLLALRRERRVELAGEGHRLADLQRWYAGKLFEEPASMQGIYIRQPGPYDVTGDGKPDFAILKTESDRDNYSVEEQESVIGWYYLDKTDLPFKISDPASGSGYVIPEKNSRSFVEPKCYYIPIPTSQISLNPNLKQPPGW